MIFVDDLNMPRVDSYGTQQPIALLKFLVERGIMWDRSTKDDGKGERLSQRKFKDLLYLAAMAPPVWLACARSLGPTLSVSRCALFPSLCVGRWSWRCGPALRVAV